MAYINQPLADIQQLNTYESISPWETPSCGSSSQSFLSQEMDRKEKTKAAKGQSQQHQRVLQSQQQAGPGSYQLCTGSPSEQSRAEILAEHPWRQKVCAASPHSFKYQERGELWC